MWGVTTGAYSVHMPQCHAGFIYELFGPRRVSHAPSECVMILRCQQQRGAVTVSLFVPVAFLHRQTLRAQPRGLLCNHIVCVMRRCDNARIKHPGAGTVCGTMRPRMRLVFFFLVGVRAVLFGLFVFLFVCKYYIYVYARAKHSYTIHIPL